MVVDSQTNMMQNAGGCVPQETVINDVSLAHAYVPFEKLCVTFSPLDGLKKGTIFPALSNLYDWQRNGTGENMYE